MVRVVPKHYRPAASSLIQGFTGLQRQLAEQAAAPDTADYPAIGRLLHSGLTNLLKHLLK
ncbi:hypothetical protein D3C84_1258480 [compost metagenome]